jgi:glycosyltransferase involved in cell wall biosynthesis
MGKKLTIVFPAYNDHAQLERALNALRDQTFKDFEVVILDDVASLSYEEVISAFRSFFNIRIIQNPRNLGAMDNMFKSIQFPVDTPYIMSHHTDDFLKSDYLERAVAILDAQSNISFVLTGPEWVSLETPYRMEHTYTNASTAFDASDFARNVIHLAPYMFGSVIYRAAHRVIDWDFGRFNILCDRFFLGSILQKHGTYGVFLEGRGIFERDHSRDKSDNRIVGLGLAHMIELLRFYQELLKQKYSPKKISIWITNYALYALASLPKTYSFWALYRTLVAQSLIHPLSVRSLGLYAIVRLLLPRKWPKTI